MTTGRVILPMLLTAAMTVVGSCGRREATPGADYTVTVDFGYILDLAADYAARYRALPDDDIRRQDFLLDTQSRIYTLAREVSETHARIFAEEFERLALNP